MNDTRVLVVDDNKMVARTLATMVANNAPVELRATAFGLFYLMSGLSMLVASALAGFLWDTWGASATFMAGIFFSLIALLLLIKQKGFKPPG